MKTIVVRLPDPLAAEIEAESRERNISKSDVVRERLETAPRGGQKTSSLESIADLIGSVDDDLPTDLSARKKHYLRVTGYGQNRSR
jgi:Arc/MetJ-type ribon-helix-helix transcriptional regulator